MFSLQRSLYKNKKVSETETERRTNRQLGAWICAALQLIGAIVIKGQ